MLPLTDGEIQDLIDNATAGNWSPVQRGRCDGSPLNGLRPAGRGRP